eukprot:CAMPEP_0179258582 /NCGR_PEP_ID=MMETSP0797-20121207/25390_1 /TAXON_ID=47934 /ORGANISM="Dinophysis acuminata, Strain DAEP01" /LENGTH=630 /DNA_ID=CAMNT_0020966619 /DNA_START=19 /DNA_END=1908 /DNA_ORIENTATION=-
MEHTWRGGEHGRLEAAAFEPISHFSAPGAGAGGVDAEGADMQADHFRTMCNALEVEKGGQVELEHLYARIGEMEAERQELLSHVGRLQAMCSAAADDRAELEELRARWLGAPGAPGDGSAPAGQAGRAVEQLQADQIYFESQAKEALQKQALLAAENVNAKEEIREFALRVDAYGAENDELRREQQLLVAELVQLRGEASPSDSAHRDSAAAGAEEMCRQAEQHAVERGTLEASVARFRAENDILAAENRRLMAALSVADENSLCERAFQAELEAVTRAGMRAAELEVASMHQRDEARLQRDEAHGRAIQLEVRLMEAAAQQSALAAAEQWVLYNIPPPWQTTCITYLGRVVVAFNAPPVAVAEGGPQAAQATAALERGDIARSALHTYRAYDRARGGCLGWQSGAVQNFVDAVFHQFSLASPSPDLVAELYRRFDQDGKMELAAHGCLCLADALFRATLLGGVQPQGGAAATANGAALLAEGPLMSDLGRGSGPLQALNRAAEPLEVLQQRLQARLQEAERAAERALVVTKDAPAVGFLDAGATGIALHEAEKWQRMARASDQFVAGSAPRLCPPSSPAGSSTTQPRSVLDGRAHPATEAPGAATAAALRAREAGAQGAAHCTPALQQV